MTTETPDTVHGRLLEAVHISGYTFERACGELEWLLDHDRWKSVGRGYRDINAFLATLKTFDEFRVAAEQRKRLARKLATLQASQRATARLTGVTHPTIAKDLGKKFPRKTKTGQVIDAESIDAGKNLPPAEWFQADADPSRDGKRLASQAARQDERAEQRRGAAARAKSTIGTPDDRVRHEAFTVTAARLDPDTVGLVFTDPPYHDVTLSVYLDLARVAARVLKPGASLITYTSHHRIPEVISMIQSAGLTFFWPIAMVHTGQNARMTEYGIVVHWKPLLWFVKGRFRDRSDLRFVNDLVTSQREKDAHPWQQGTIEARYYIEALTQPGDLVFDPFCGGGTTAVAAVQTGRDFLTCDIDEDSTWIARQRIREASEGVA